MMDASNSLVIETRNLSKAYKGVPALKDLSLTVKAHSIFGFLGPNGAGKSTTIKLLLGLIQPSGGRATIIGHAVWRNSLAIRKRAGYLAQEPRYYEHLTARSSSTQRASSIAGRTYGVPLSCWGARAPEQDTLPAPPRSSMVSDRADHRSLCRQSRS
jgi:ABC-type uncharacterized transport system ATPase subunit